MEKVSQIFLNQTFFSGLPETKDQRLQDKCWTRDTVKCLENTKNLRISPDFATFLLLITSWTISFDTHWSLQANQPHGQFWEKHFHYKSWVKPNILIKNDQKVLFCTSDYPLQAKIFRCDTACGIQKYKIWSFSSLKVLLFISRLRLVVQKLASKDFADDITLLRTRKRDRNLLCDNCPYVNLMWFLVCTWTLISLKKKWNKI